MQRSLIAIFATIAAASSAPLHTQMHKVAAPEQVVRAVGVYEWIGDEAKPAASRFIPVTLFIDGKLEDAAVYLARPIPFALDSGTLYEVDRAGVPQGTLSVVYASHLQPVDGAAGEASNYDDGWFGYGTFTLPTPPKKAATLRASKTPSTLVSSKADTAKPDPDRPTFARKSGDAAPDDKTSATPAPATPATSTTAASSTVPATDDDPDRPHLIRKPEADTPPDSGATAGSPPAGTAPAPSAGTNPAADPDRPTLRKRSPEEAKKARKEAQESSATGLATSLNDDPNRPTLHHGSGQQVLTEASFPKLKGAPIELRQQVAVSDAKSRPAHDFSRPWADDAEHATVLANLQDLARVQIAGYRKQFPVSQPPTPAPAAAKRTPNSKLRRAKPVDADLVPVSLLDEKLSGYTLSYGGAATYVYTARTDGEGPTLIYVTVVAQRNALGQLEPALQSVTDAAHLDRAPWMRLVDVVDAEASNRASLLFELRSNNARQFALYRVIAARSEQIFLTGTTQ